MYSKFITLTFFIYISINCVNFLHNSKSNWTIIIYWCRLLVLEICIYYKSDHTMTCKYCLVEHQKNNKCVNKSSIVLFANTRRQNKISPHQATIIAILFDIYQDKMFLSLVQSIAQVITSSITIRRRSISKNSTTELCFNSRYS